jgi:hypothetical protein
MTRPTGVVILTVLAAINGVGLTLAGLGTLLNVRFPYLSELQSQPTGLGELVVGLGWLALAAGFWIGNRWARLVGLIWAGLSIAFGLWVLVVNLNFLSTILVPVLLALVIPVAVYVYLNEEHVKEYFR